MTECKVSKIVRKHNRETAVREAADKLARMLEELLAVQEKVAFAVCGGRSVEGVFVRLAKKDIQWSRVHIFLVDERFVPMGDEESNFRLVQEHLLNNRSCTIQDEQHPDWDHATCIPSENVHPFLVEKGINGYEEELLSVRNCYDIVLLSSGEDGHVGALYPNHHSFTNNALLFIEMEDSPKPPAHRMSLSREHLKKAHGVVVLFLGEAKRAALKKFQDASLDESACPARLANFSEHAYIITDIN